MTNQVPVFRLYPGEVGFLGLLVIVSGYMWYGSYEYDSLAGFFPRLMSVLVLVLSATLLVRRSPVFPDRLRNIIESDSGSFGDVEESFGEEEDEEASVDQEDEQFGATRKAVILGILTGLYMLVGFFFGLLWGTPFYMIAYLRYTKQSWPLTIVLTIVVTALVYGMMDIFNLTLETGWVLRTLGIEVPLTIVADSLPSGLILGGVN
jgi:hypothetical protein